MKRDAHLELAKDEAEEWLRMTPRQRLVESERLWAAYLALGGSLEPEYDSQSPFNFLYYPDARRPQSNDRRPGTHRLRRHEQE
jgi:hypothetical protein